MRFLPAYSVLEVLTAAAREAFFELEEWESAKASFDLAAGEASKAGVDATSFQRWARKCQAELDLEEDEEEDDDDEAQEPAPEKQAVQTPACAKLEEDAPLPPIARPKVRHEWYQSQSHVVVEIFLKNLKKEAVHVNLAAQHLDIAIKVCSILEEQALSSRKLGSYLQCALEPFLCSGCCIEFVGAICFGSCVCSLYRAPLPIRHEISMRR